jgi:hypothetical protein
MEIDFTKLSPEQVKILREILKTCQYFQISNAWNPPVSDDVLARQARELEDGTTRKTFVKEFSVGYRDFLS